LIIVYKTVTCSSFISYLSRGLLGCDTV